MSFQRVFVVGSSAGGLPVLRQLAAQLPPSFPAPILVVQHIGARPSLLPRLLEAAGPLPASHAVDGAPLSPGRFFVAPPDRHLVVEQGRVRLSSGPKENHTRPAVDPLFRSAALVYGPAVVGVVLSGSLDDGTFGLQAIKACGGTTVVQDPATADDPGMPGSALHHVSVDHCVPPEALAQLLTAMAHEPAGSAGPCSPSHAYEADLATMKGDPIHNLSQIADVTTYGCPDCRGALWRVRGASPPRLRCYTGHSYTLATLRGAKEEGLDSALWSAVRALEEKYALLTEIAAAAAPNDDGRLRSQAEDALQASYRLRTLIGAPPRHDPPE